ncbi:MAG: neocarzinostatin apoprotein domain-containing protein [Gordonia sp. (in: high G+C Gram-positive bacteria)]
MQRTPRVGAPASTTVSAIVLTLLLIVAGGFAPHASAEPASGPALRVTPSTDLSSGDQVTVTGSGFRPNAQLLMAQTMQLGRFGLPVANTGKRHIATDRSGKFSAQLTVRQRFANIDCGKTRCFVAVVLAPLPGLADRSQDRSVPISFRDGTGPRLTVTPSTMLRQGTDVTVTGTGFVKNSKLLVAQTVARPASGRPGPHMIPVAVTADGSGKFVAKLEVTPRIGDIRCLQTPCFIAAYPVDPLVKNDDAWAPIAFDPSDGTALSIDKPVLPQAETARINLVGAQPLDDFKIKLDGPADITAQPIVSADNAGNASVLIMSDIQQAAGEYTIHFTNERTGNVTQLGFTVRPNGVFAEPTGVPIAEQPPAEMGPTPTIVPLAGPVPGPTASWTSPWVIVVAVLMIAFICVAGWFARD